MVERQILIFLQIAIPDYKTLNGFWFMKLYLLSFKDSVDILVFIFIKNIFCQ